MHYKGDSIEDRDAAVERLRDFLRSSYMTGAEAARRIGVRDMTLYSWLQGNRKPSSAERIIAFLDSIPAERAGITPTGYEYREYKDWRWRGSCWMPLEGIVRLERLGFSRYSNNNLTSR